MGIVAILHAHLYEAVPARCQPAAGEAGIRIHSVSVVARLDACADKPIAARGDETSTQARVCIDIVSVIALLGSLNHAVAAGAQGALVAAVRRI